MSILQRAVLQVSEVEPVYTTIKVNSKDRRVRRFGECVFTNKRGESKVIRPAEYLYIKNEPNTHFSKEV